MNHSDLTNNELFSKIKSGEIVLGGHSGLKIYGTLGCWSGKKMHKDNRVFFANEQGAVDAGYRPCGHCCKVKYQDWKASA